MNMATLRTPHPKIAQRLLREAMAAVARERSSGLLEVEGIYLNTRSALSHLLAHDRYRTRIESKVKDLLQKHRELMDQPDIVQYFGDLEMRAIRHALQCAEVFRAGIPIDSERQRQVYDSFDFLMKRAVALTERPGVLDVLGQCRVQKIETAAAGLNRCYLEMLEEAAVKPQHLAVFEQVVEQVRSKYAGEGYDFSSFIPERLTQLAYMVSNRFDVYDKVLNDV